MTFDELQGGGERVRHHFNQALDLTLDYDHHTVAWLDGYIARNRDIFTEDRKYGWALAFGYILGEAIVRVHGGQWVQDPPFDDEWVVDLGGTVGRANPIGKAYKYLGDQSDSILSFFEVIGSIKEKGGLNTR